MRPATFITLILLFSSGAFACLNGESIRLSDENNTMLYLDEEGAYVPEGHSFRIPEDEVEKIKKELYEQWESSGKTMYLTEVGLILTYQKDYKGARDIFLQVEKLNPGKYETAANLGTVYELLGENKLALQWIRRAVQINSYAHRKSEWIHIKILEAKVSPAAKLTSQLLLGTNFGFTAAPTTDLSKKELSDLRDQLYYQLNERITFVKPRDSIVAILLFDMANIASIEGAKEEAIDLYREAREYGFNDPILDARQKYISGKDVDKGYIYRSEMISESIPSASSAYLKYLLSVPVVMIIAYFARRVRGKAEED